MVRSVPLRGFDRQMADLIAESMTLKGIKFLYKCLPTGVQKQEDGRLLVSWKDETGKVYSDVYDTLLLAIGRKALTEDLQLQNAGVKPEENSKLHAKNEQTNVPHIFAVGDVLDVSISRGFTVKISHSKLNSAMNIP